MSVGFVIVVFIVLVIVVGVPIIYWSNRPEAEKRTAWARILRSIPLIGSVSSLLFIWADMICDCVAGWLVNFLFEGGFSRTGQHPDYRLARLHRRDGERAEAMAAIRTELDKDAKNFEGRLMLAEIYEDMNQPKEAMEQIDIILNNPAATPDQKEVARNEREKCRRQEKNLAASEFIQQQNRK
jgi:hypothetical protein